MPNQMHNDDGSFKAKKPKDAKVGSFDGSFKQGPNARPGTPDAVGDYPSFYGNATGGKDNGKMN